MSHGFDTLAIHAGQPNDERTGAVAFPIYQTSTYGQIEPGVSRGFAYSRTDNPTRRALEENLAALEGSGYGVAFAVGTRLFTLAESLGSVKSLLCHPSTMTHISVEPEVRRRNGITDGLIRLSVGIEDAADLTADLARALDRAAAGVRANAAEAVS